MMNVLVKISTVLFFGFTMHFGVAREVDQALPPEVPKNMNLLRFDANQDGQMTRDEISAAHLQHFKQLDADGDNVISEAEFKRPPRGKMKGEMPAPPPPIACEDKTAECAPPKPMKRQQHQQQHFKQFDSNEDGHISQAEFMAKLPSFERFDCDHNGIITQTELRNKSCQASQ